MPSPKSRRYLGKFKHPPKMLSPTLSSRLALALPCKTRSPGSAAVVIRLSGSDKRYSAGESSKRGEFMDKNSVLVLNEVYED
jgi:hypothetical protein